MTRQSNSAEVGDDLSVGACRECGDEIDVGLASKWSAEELQVCENCWWTELDGDDRREIAREANQ